MHNQHRDKEHQQKIQASMEMQYGRHQIVEVVVYTHGTQITLTILTLMVRFFLVVAITAVRPVPACFVSATPMAII